MSNPQPFSFLGPRHITTSADSHVFYVTVKGQSLIAVQKIYSTLSNIQKQLRVKCLA